MVKARAPLSSLMLLMLSWIAAQAQTEATKIDRSSGATVTATASGERVRFTAPSSVVQIRLEVYDSTGRKLFDNEVRGGNVLDWHLQDAQAEPLADDSYLCVVTVKSLSGRLTQRIGSVRLERKSASVKAVESSEITAQQSQTIGPIEENASLTVLTEDENRTPTVIAHNGEEGQITRGRGALSFRIGDFYSGKDVEQMRLTPEGNLGIGITHPQARLDVDGLIRSSLGIVFPDGSIQYSAATKTYGARSTLPGGSLQSKSKTSSGGQERIETVLANYIPKFTDNGGTLGNTIAPIYETVGGSVGIGTTTPDPFKLNVNGSLNIGGSNLYLGGFLRFTDNAAAGYTNFVALNGNLTNFDGVNYEQLNLYNPGGDKAIHLGETASGSQIASIGAGNTTLTLQPSGGFVGIGRSTKVSALEVFGVQSNFGGTAFGGMYIKTDSATGKPFYGYSLNGPQSAYHYVDGNDGGKWKLNVGSGDVLTATPDGNVGIGTTDPSIFYKLEVSSSVGSGVRVTATSLYGIGVFSNSDSGRGVEGDTSSGTGVFGFSSGAGNSTGVFGQNSSSGIGVAAASESGNIMEGYGSGVRKFHIDNNGVYTAGSDFAEALPAYGKRASYEAGDVLVVSAKSPGTVEKSSRPYDQRLVGVYSTRPGVLGADKAGTSRVDPDELPVAIVGIVPTKVSTENGPVLPGDLLTSSSTVGYAMKASPVRVGRARIYRPGAILGKALEPLEEGKGVIKVLVTLR